MIQLNEVQKLREAQRRDQQENKENWERSRRRCMGETDQLSPISVDEDSQGTFMVILCTKFFSLRSHMFMMKHYF